MAVKKIIVIVKETLLTDCSSFESSFPYDCRRFDKVELGLEDSAHSRLGNWYFRGISSREKKKAYQLRC